MTRRRPRKRGGRGRRFRMLLRSIAGLAIAPTAIAALLVAAGVLGGLTPGASGGMVRFLAGFGGYAAAHILHLARFRRLYVYAHELTHALAVWLTGGKVYKFEVRGESGHVDLSRSDTFIALAPYCFPLITLLVVGVYRLLLWAGPPVHSREVFLALMGASLAFHFSHTVESLWQTHQSDLDEAGFSLSISLIILLNGLLVLGALKCLFPEHVAIGESLGRIGAVTSEFWRQSAGLCRRALAAVR